MVNKALCSKTACNSYDPTQVARWRTRATRWALPYREHATSQANIEQAKARWGTCMHCDGAGCRKCNRSGYSYAMWLHDRECERLTEGCDPSKPLRT